MLFDKATDLSPLVNAYNQAIAEKWPDPNTRPQNLRSPFRDGDAERADVDGYQNVIFVNASSLQKVGVVDENTQPIMQEDDFYAGCYAIATLTCYAYQKMGNAGAAFGLQNVMKRRDGDRFSSRLSAEADFAEFAPQMGATPLPTAPAVNPVTPQPNAPTVNPVSPGPLAPPPNWQT